LYKKHERNTILIVFIERKFFIYIYIYFFKIHLYNEYLLYLTYNINHLNYYRKRILKK